MVEARYPGMYWAACKIDDLASSTIHTILPRDRDADIQMSDGTQMGVEFIIKGLVLWALYENLGSWIGTENAHIAGRIYQYALGAAVAIKVAKYATGFANDRHLIDTWPSARWYGQNWRRDGEKI